MREPRCPKTYMLDWDNRAPCGLPVRHQGPCGPDRGQPVLPKPPHYQETSRMAFQSLSEVHGDIAREVIHHLQEHPYTTDEVEVLTNRPHQTISATISHLWHDLKVIRPMTDHVGQRIRRKTRSGRLADVYELVPWP